MVPVYGAPPSCEEATPWKHFKTNTRISLSNILVTTDFSKVSKNALPFAAALARQYEAKIIVAHALSPEPHLSVPLDPLPQTPIGLSWKRREDSRNLLSATPWE